jgi:hypothetical protein
VWGKLPASSYSTEQVRDLRTKLQALMSGELGFVSQHP